MIAALSKPSSLASACLLLAVATTAFAQNCSWDPTFGNPGPNNFVRAVRTHDDGAGPALYAAGAFTLTPDGPANRIARRSGGTWSPVGDGISGTGSPEVFALSAWNGNLFAAGSFTLAGATSALNIARWDGTTWFACPDSPCNGLAGTCFSMAGTEAASPVGPALYAGGSFSTAGCTSAKGIARWDGTTWSALGSGMLAIDNTLGTVYALLVHNGVLYAGGVFNRAGGVTVNSVGRWNGSTWAPMGTGMSGVAFPSVYALGLYNDQVIAGGYFAVADGRAANYIARWTGTSWASLGTGTGGAIPTLRNVRALATWDDHQGGGPALYVGGEFISAGGNNVYYVARWNGTSWSGLPPTGTTQGTNAPVQALWGSNEPTLDGLYAGGLFSMAGGRTSRFIARWSCIPVPTEACCFTGGACQNLAAAACTSQGGQSQGAATSCATSTCGNPCSGLRPGDFTDDGHVDGADIPAFTAEMISPDPPATPNFCRANFVTGDSPEVLNEADVQAFVACLLDAGRCP